MIKGKYKVSDVVLVYYLTRSLTRRVSD